MVALANYQWNVGNTLSFYIKTSERKKSNMIVQAWFWDPNSIIAFGYTALVVHNQFLQLMPSFTIESTGLIDTNQLYAAKTCRFSRSDYKWNNLKTAVYFNMVRLYDDQAGQDSDIYGYQIRIYSTSSWYGYRYYYYIINLRMQSGFETYRKANLSIILYKESQSFAANTSITIQDGWANLQSSSQFTLKGDTNNETNNAFFGISEIFLGNCSEKLVWNTSYLDQQTLGISAEGQNCTVNKFTVVMLIFQKLVCSKQYQYINQTDGLCDGCFYAMHYEPTIQKCICSAPLVANSDDNCQKCPKQHGYNTSSFKCQPCPSGCSSCNISETSYKCISCVDQYVLTFFQTCCKPLLACKLLQCDQNTESICLLCDLQKYFEVKENKCACMFGYHFEENTQTCHSVCGNQIKTADQGCDDGNTINGDGCSSVCLKEPGYTCSQEQDTSKCLFTDPTQLAYISAERSKTQNMATLKFTLEPEMKWWSEATIKNIQIIPSLFLETQIKRQNNDIMIVGTFNSTIENMEFSLSVLLDSGYLDESMSNISVSFTAIGSNQPLQYINYIDPDSGNQSADIKQYIVYGILANMIILLILSILTHRMVGPQTIISAQTSYFCLIILQTITYSNSFNILKYMNGSVGMSIIDEVSIVPDSLANIGFKSHYTINNTACAAVVIVISCVVTLIYKIKLSRSQSQLKQLEKKHKKKQIQIKKAQIDFKNNQFKFYTVFFRGVQSCCLSFMPIYIWAVQINLTCRPQKKPSMGVQHLINQLSTVFCYLTILIMVWVQLVAQRSVFLKTPKVSMNHFPVFLFSKVVFIVLLICGYLTFPINAKYMMALMELLYLLYVIFYWPYEHRFHNVSLILNQLPAMLIIGLGFYQDFTDEVSKEQMQLFQYGYIGLLLLLIICSYARIIIYRCSGGTYQIVVGKKGKSKGQANDNKKQKIDQKKQTQNQKKQKRGNPYSLKNILYNQKVENYKDINQTRRKQGFTQFTLPKGPTAIVRKEQSQLRKPTQEDKKELKKMKQYLTRNIYK